MTFEIDSPRYGKHIVEIDDEDAEKVLSYKWYICKNTSKLHLDNLFITANVEVGGKKTTLSLTRLLTGFKLCSHIDRDALNNKKSNLLARSVTEKNRGSGKISKKKTSSVWKGVSYIARLKKWRAYVVCDRKQRHIGVYSSEEEAAEAYNKAAVSLFGKFARLNVI